MRLRIALAVLLLACCSKPPPAKPATGNQSTTSNTAQTDRAGEYFAWEKSWDDKKQFRYKQVKKNYFLNSELCRNVIDVLAEARRSSTETRYSEFECWPASTNPDQYYRKYSATSDLPSAVVLPSIR